MIKNFEKISESETMFFHAVNMMKHDFIFEISWLIAHNFIMNWNAKLWCYCLTDDWIIIEKFKVFMQFIQNDETVYWWNQIKKIDKQSKLFMS